MNTYTHCGGRLSVILFACNWRRDVLNLIETRSSQKTLPQSKKKSFADCSYFCRYVTVFSRILSIDSGCVLTSDANNFSTFRDEGIWQRLRMKVAVEWLTFLFRVREILGSNFNPENDCPLCCFLVLPREYRNSTWGHDHFLPCPFRFINPTVLRYVVCMTNFVLSIAYISEILNIQNCTCYIS